MAGLNPPVPPEVDSRKSLQVYEMETVWSHFKKILWDWRAVAITTPSVTLLVLMLRFAGGLQVWEWAAYDQYMRLRPPQPSEHPIVLVGIDEADLKAIGQDPLPDGVLAEALQKIKDENPVAIGLDYYRNLPAEPGHADLVELFENTPNLIGIEKVVGEAGRESVESASVLKQLGQIGSNDVIVDGDQRVRRGLISVDLPEGDTVFSFSFYLALIYLDAQGIGIEMLPDGVNWTLGKAAFPRFQPSDGGYIRTDAGGHQILINYQGSTRYFPVFSLREVLNDRVSPGWATGKIVMIGPFSEASKDYFYTPYSASLLSLPEPMYGVEIHAQLANQFIQTAQGNNRLIQNWPEPVEWIWVLLWSGVGAVLAWQSRKIQTLQFDRFAGLVISFLLLIATTYGLFVQGWWVPLIPPGLSFLLAAITVTGYIAQTAGDIRKTFGRYLSDEIVTTLLDSPEGLKMGGERRKITILTSDLRGFTALSERLPPEEVIKILNFYLSAMADVITDYRGTIDEFMGDGILVLFGAPTASEDDADRAMACAVAMQKAMEPVNQQMRSWGLNELEMGVGINTGEVVVGNIGSIKRTKYGVVGNQVNLTYRVESYTIGGQILISEMTRQALTVPIDIESEQQVMPKGVTNLISIYSVVGVGEPYNLHLNQQDDEFVPLPEAVPIQYVVLSGKHVGDTFVQGQIVELSRKRAKVEQFALGSDQVLAEEAIEPLSNIKLNLLPSSSWADLSEDMYAKVLDITASPGSFYIYFTAKPPALAKHLNALYKSGFEAQKV